MLFLKVFQVPLESTVLSILYGIVLITQKSVQRPFANPVFGRYEIVLHNQNSLKK